MCIAILGVVLWRPTPFGAKEGAFVNLADTQAGAKRCECVVFHHVPKSAGTSMYHAAEAMFGKSNVWIKYADQRGKQPPPGYRFYAGHLTPALNTSCCRMTVLRSPVERVLSLLRYHGHKSATKQLRVMSTDSWTTDKTVCTGWCAEYHNELVHFMVSLEWDHYSPNYVTSPREMRWTDVGRATATIRAMDFVCVQEYLQLCLNRIAAATGVPDVHTRLSLDGSRVLSPSNKPTPLSA